MADLEQALAAKIAAHGLGGLAGTPPRVFNVKSPQGSKYPLVVFQDLTVVRRHAMGADTGVLETPVRFTTRAPTLAEARTVDAQLRACFARGPWTAASVVVQDSLIEGTEPDFNPELDVHEVLTDIVFWSVGT